MKLNRAHAEVGPNHDERKEDIGAPIKLDAEAQAHIEKHRYAIFFLICEKISKVQLNAHIIPIHSFFIAQEQSIYRVHSLSGVSKIVV